jgi:hypothetical protein
MLWGLFGVIGLLVFVFNKDLATMQCNYLSRLLAGRLKFSPTFINAIRGFDIAWAIACIGVVVAGVVHAL